MHNFEHVRAHLGGRHELHTNDPYLLGFDIDLPDARHQGIYLAEMEDEEGRKYLRISTPVGPANGLDANRCLRFNWVQHTGYMAISDLDGAPYLHLCENRPYELLQSVELERVIEEFGRLGDRLEQIISNGEDNF